MLVGYVSLNEIFIFHWPPHSLLTIIILLSADRPTHLFVFLHITLSYSSVLPCNRVMNAEHELLKQLDLKSK